MTAFEQAITAATDLASGVKAKAIDVIHKLFQDRNATPEIDEEGMPDIPYDKKPIDKKRICPLCGMATVMEPQRKDEPTACMTCGKVQ